MVICGRDVSQGEGKEPLWSKSRLPIGSEYLGFGFFCGLVTRRRGKKELLTGRDRYRGQNSDKIVCAFLEDVMEHGPKLGGTGGSASAKWKCESVAFCFLLTLGPRWMSWMPSKGTQASQRGQENNRR